MEENPVPGTHGTAGCAGCHLGNEIGIQQERVAGAGGTCGGGAVDDQLPGFPGALAASSLVPDVKLSGSEGVPVQQTHVVETPVEVIVACTVVMKFCQYAPSAGG